MTVDEVNTPSEQLSNYRNLINEAIQPSTNSKVPGLYAPIDYLMQLGGKRIRPAMVLAAAEAFGASQHNAIPAAMAIETFHNFTLMHDDIMDAAPLRRGKPTVHEKWDENSAILSGDAMLVQAYQHLAKCEPSKLPPLMKLFNTTAIEVCEGQQLDMEFENRSDVSVDEYLEMIRLKTSVLLAAALQMGAMIAGANAEDATKIYDYGISVGLAFQLQDDYLDAFGDPEKFGKQVGGDILADKKTFLYLTCREHANAEQLALLDELHGRTPVNKVELVKQIFLDSGAAEAAKNKMTYFHDHALEVLDSIQCSESGQALFRFLAEMVLVRKS